MVDAPGGEAYAAAPSSAVEDPFASAHDGAALTDEATAPRRRLLLVALEDAVVALPASDVVEVLPARPLARIPGAAASVAGVANRRGRMLTILDLGLALGGRATAAGDGHRVVVVSWADREVGLAVRDVLQITSDWWTERSGEDASTREAEVARTDAGTAQGEPEVDQQLRVVELDTVLAPLFGGADHGVGEPTTERS